MLSTERSIIYLMYYFVCLKNMPQKRIKNNIKKDTVVIINLAYVQPCNQNFSNIGIGTKAVRSRSKAITKL